MEKKDGYIIIDSEIKTKHFSVNIDNINYVAKRFDYRYIFISELFASFIARFYDENAVLYYPAMNKNSEVYSLSEDFSNNEKVNNISSLLVSRWDNSLNSLLNIIKENSQKDYKQLILSIIIDAFLFNIDRSYANILKVNNKLISSFDYDLSFGVPFYSFRYESYYKDGNKDLLNEIYGQESLNEIDMKLKPHYNFYGKITYLELLDELKKKFNQVIEEILDTLDYEQMLINFESFHDISLDSVIKEIYINLGNTRLRRIKNELYGNKR